MKSWSLLNLILLHLAVAMSSAMALQPRQEVQAQAVVPCPNGLPFLCQANTECVPTNAQNTSVVCCPQGKDCGIIGQIFCDISQQNVTQYPENMVHTTELDAELPKCGNLCCPLGYNCAGNLCVKQPTPDGTSSTTSVIPPVATTAPSATSISSATSPVSPISGDSPAGQPHSNTKAIAIGVPVAILVAALIGLALLYFLKRRRRQRQGDNYMNEKPLRRTSSNSTDFMGRTPRPLSLQEQYSAPLHTPPAQSHSRSQSEPQPAAADNSNGSVVSQPMWNAQLSGGAPLHRTDFLLRRGSVETGYEDKVKPSWSTRSKYRPKSLKRLTLTNRSATEPHKTPSGKSTRLTPMFSTPLRFGLPLSPSPGKNKLAIPASRPPRHDENLAKLVKLEGKTVNSGEAKHVTHVMPSPKKAKKMRLRDRSESARRPLVAEGETASRDQSVDTLGDRKVRGQSLERQDSDASATTIESDTTVHSGTSTERGRGRHGANASSETINVLLPPPSLFQTPPPTNVRSPPSSDERARGPREMVEVRRETTWEDMIRQAGWK